MNDAAPRIQRKPGWSGHDLSKDAVTVRLNEAHRRAIAELMQGIRTRGLRFAEVTRHDFSHPALDGFLADFIGRLRDGTGLLVLGGFPVADYPLAEIETIYWGVGTHFGEAVSQSASGDLLGHVTDKSAPQHGKIGRGYQSARALNMHSDSAEFVGLLYVRPAKSGGENVFASALRVHEIIAAEHPEHLAVLERGFPYHRRGEEAPGTEAITPYDVPIFSRQDGILSCRYSTEGFLAALHHLGREMTARERDAIACFEATALRPDLRFDLRAEAGEAVFVNNFEILHSRAAFEDWPEPERHRLLLRLWLQGVPPRPMRHEMFAFQNSGGRMGIDHQPGREPGRVGYEIIR